MMSETGGKSPLKILDEQYVRPFEAHLEAFCKEERNGIPERLATGYAVLNCYKCLKMVR